MGRAALHVVGSAPFYREEVELWATENSKDAHSLHYLIAYPGAFRPELPAYFINKYTSKGDWVLDPFCGGGTTALEANLLGRKACASDVNPLALKVTRAKLEPADLTEVTLRLQLMNLKRPVPLNNYQKIYAPFFDTDTFCEIANLRQSLQHNYDKVARFVELIAASLLHGHSAGYFSVYTYPQLSLSPAEQERFNFNRRQVPEYRAIVPRILRKMAATQRDGYSSEFLRVVASNRLAITDACNLHYLPDASIDLVVTAPPLLGRRESASEQWLRYWFLGINPEGIENKSCPVDSLDEWQEYMNGALLEMARVVKPGRRAILDLREVQFRGESICLDQEVQQIISDNLSRFWEAECLLLQKQQYAKLKHCLKPRDVAGHEKRHRLLVLRRR